MSRSALAAQAFVRMMENGGGKCKANRADMVIVCDLRAYRRGHTYEGEPCHIIGGGPIPVTLAKELGRDAFLKAVLHTGTELHTIAHFGRRWPALLRTALDLGAPPDFNGNICAAPGCDRQYHLQDDHIDPVADQDRTRPQGRAPPPAQETRRPRPQAGRPEPGPIAAPSPLSGLATCDFNRIHFPRLTSPPIFDNSIAGARLQRLAVR